MKTHLRDSNERKHYLIKKLESIDPKVETIYCGTYSAQKGVVSVLHSHSFLEIMFIHSGSGFIEVDGKPNSVKKNTVIFYYPGQLHREWTYDDSNMEISFFSVRFSSSLMKTLSPVKDISIFPLRSNIKEISDLFETLIRQSQSSQELYKDKIANSIAKITILKVLQEMPISKEAVETNEIVSQISSYLNNHFKEEIEFEKLYLKYHISKFYISRLFKDIMGTTPLNYLINKRVDEAKHLLLTTDMKIQDIAYEVGYKDIYYFTKSFKNEVGESPSAFRDENRKG